MARIGGRMMSLQVDGEERANEVSRAAVTSGDAESDFVTFAEARAGGGRDYKLAMTIVQDDAAGTLWSDIFDNVGDQVPYVMAPHGNTTPSVTEPHYTGNAIIKEPDGDFIGGEANADPSTPMTVEVEWDCTGRPVKVTS